MNFKLLSLILWPLMFIILNLVPSLVLGATRLNIEAVQMSDTSGIKSYGTTSKTHIDGSFLFSFWAESSFYFGAGLFNNIEVAPVGTSSNSNLNTIAPYAGFSKFFQKQLYSIAGFYIPTATAAYSESGQGTENWTGSGYAGQVSVHPALNKYMAVSVSIKYISLNYINKSGATISTVNSFSRTSLVPSLGLQFFW